MPVCNGRSGNQHEIDPCAPGAATPGSPGFDHFADAGALHVHERRASDNGDRLRELTDLQHRVDDWRGRRPAGRCRSERRCGNPGATPPTDTDRSAGSAARKSLLVGHAVRVNARCGLRHGDGTPGSTAPLGSVTRPLSWAVDSCAQATAAGQKKTQHADTETPSESASSCPPPVFETCACTSDE